MKIGDKVRFLSETGGGVVAGFQGKGIVLVEDEDGFRIPVAVRDVVVVGDGPRAGGDTRTKDVRPAEMPAGARATKTGGGDVIRTGGVNAVSGGTRQGGGQSQPADAPYERQGGDVLCAYIAFVPVDIKEVTSTRFEAYFVNDCNYAMRYFIFTAENAAWRLRFTGEAEPNTVLFLDEFGRDDLNGIERMDVQIAAYKKGKPFALKPCVDVAVRIDTVKFYKLHTFTETPFFDEPALLYTVIENDKPARHAAMEPGELREALSMKWKTDTARPKKEPEKKKPDTDETLVVDLHASRLLDTTAGLAPADILGYQLDTVRKTLKEHEKQKGKKIIFIHGKGNGVLRQAIIKELKRAYKTYPYQDASFREYGFGATQVTVK